MKSKKLSIAILTGVVFAASGTGAFADDKSTGEVGSNWQDHIVSTKTRAQVMAELPAARAQGQLWQNENGSFDSTYARGSNLKNGRSRDEVRMEAASANIAGRNANSYLYFGGN